MKLPVAWLKQYIDVALSPEKLADALTLSGSKVEDVHGKGEEAVIDIEVTTNRPDCLSILGLAYEVSAITGKKVRRPAEYSAKEKTFKGSSRISVEVQDKKACPRYTARVIENVKIAPSPAPMQKLLGLAGTRAISTAVDVTNHVLYECGQPLHAFDLDKIKGGKVVVRRSDKGEKFLGLDGIEYTLDDKTLVIADAEHVIAMAGVIGGKLTEVDLSTKNILLESAYFDPALVRQASKRYKVGTESSYRFERTVDADNVDGASRRAAGLIAKLCGGTDTSGLIDKDLRPKKKASSVTLRLGRLESILGMKISTARVTGILKALSLSTSSSGAGKLKVTPPSFRRDIVIEEDLAEEVLRIEGFDKAPETLPVGRRGSYRDLKAAKLPKLKEFLAHQGLDEIMTYSLLSEKVLSQSGHEASRCHAVANAVSAEQAFFRPSLLPGALGAIVFNAHRKAESLRFFEIGHCYENNAESTRLSIALYGMSESNWQRRSESSFYELKGLVANVMDHLGAEDESALKIQEVPAAVLAAWDIPKPVYFAEIALDGLLSAEPKAVRVKPVPKFPSVRRDIAFVAERSVSVAELERVMREAGAPYLKEAVLFDQFIGKNIPSGKRSLAFSLAYQKEDATFTDPEVQALQQKVGEALKGRFGVEFR